MTQQQVEAWLLENGFKEVLLNLYRRDFLDVEVIETGPGVFRFRASIYAPGHDTFLNLQLPLSEIEVIDNREVQILL